MHSARDPECYVALGGAHHPFWVGAREAGRTLGKFSPENSCAVCRSPWRLRPEPVPRQSLPQELQPERLARTEQRRGGRGGEPDAGASPSRPASPLCAAGGARTASSREAVRGARPRTQRGAENGPDPPRLSMHPESPVLAGPHFAFAHLDPNSHFTPPPHRGRTENTPPRHHPSPRLDAYLEASPLDPAGTASSKALLCRLTRE